VQAGDYAVVKEHEGNYGQDVSPEEAGKTEGADEGRSYKGAEKYENGLRDGDRMAASSFEDPDALAIVHGVLQNADRYGRWKVVEGAEDCAEAGELSGDLGGVNGFRPVSDGAVGFRVDALECRKVGVQIGEANFREAAVGVAKRFVQPGPGAAAAGTEIHDTGSLAGLEGVFQPVSDAAVDAAEAHDGLQAVGHVIAEVGGQPRLIVEFEEGHGLGIESLGLGMIPPGGLTSVLVTVKNSLPTDAGNQESRRDAGATKGG
jgi:hypothetical protein